MRVQCYINSVCYWWEHICRPLTGICCSEILLVIWFRVRVIIGVVVRLSAIFGLEVAEI